MAVHDVEKINWNISGKKNCVGKAISEDKMSDYETVSKVILMKSMHV